MTISEIFADYEDQTRDDILSAHAFAARMAHTKQTVNLTVWGLSWTPSCLGAWPAGSAPEVQAIKLGAVQYLTKPTDAG